jgi:hypothetical protein
LDLQVSPAATVSQASLTAAPRSGTPVADVVAKAIMVLACSALAVGALLLVLGRFDPFAAQSSVQWTSGAYSIVGGTGRPDGPRLIVDQLRDGEKFVAVIPRARLRARDYRALELEIRGLDAADKLAFLWRTEHTANRTFLRPVDAIAENGVGTSVRDDPNWNGEITGVGFIITGPLRGPLAIESMRAVSNAAAAGASETLRDWFAFRSWNGNAINVLLLRGDLNPLSLSLFVTLAVAAALGAWWILRRRDRRQLLVGTLVIVACAWLVQDARWLAQLGRQVQASAATFSGKSWRDKRLAAQDGALFAFLEQAREAIAARPGRVMFASDDAYVRSRAGYHLLPLNVLSNVYHAELHGHRFLRPGDYLCVYAKRGVAFDPVAGMLGWEAGAPPLRAERVLDTPPGALYRILQ